MFDSDFNPTFAYSQNGSVFFNGKGYTSLQNGNTGNAPDKSPLFWKVSDVVPGPNAKSPAGDPRNVGGQGDPRNVGGQGDPRNVGGQGDPRNVGGQGDPRNVNSNSPNFDARFDPKSPNYDAALAAKNPGGNPNTNLPSGVGNAHNASINPNTQAAYGLDDRGVKHDPEGRNVVAGTGNAGYDARFDSNSPKYDAAFATKFQAGRHTPDGSGGFAPSQGRPSQGGHNPDGYAPFQAGRHNPDGYAPPFSEPKPRREITEKEKAELEVRKAAYTKRFSEGS